MGIHPIQRKTFLDEEFILGVMVENDFCQEAVDGHDSDLAGDLHAVFHDLHVFAGFYLSRLIGEALIVVEPPLGILEIFTEAALRIVRCGLVDFAVGVNSAQAFGDFLGIGFFEKEPVEPDASVALGILLDEIGHILGKFYLAEPVALVKWAGLGKFGDFLAKLLLLVAEFFG